MSKGYSNIHKGRNECVRGEQGGIVPVAGMVGSGAIEVIYRLPKATE
jgi:hypothetical protein